MNENMVVQNLIKFIEERERQLQAAKLLNNNQAKNDIVQSILRELDSEIDKECSDENK